jgi:multidrug efflux pump subunit AcrA (membrane-fusion protein)
VGIPANQLAVLLKLDSPNFPAHPIHVFCSAREYLVMMRFDLLARWALVVVIVGGLGFAANIAVSREGIASKSQGITGIVMAIDEVRVPARDAGQLIDFSREISGEGKVVKKGDVLGRIDDRDLKIKETSAAAQVKSAKNTAKSDDEYQAAIKTREVAEIEWLRSKELNEKNKNIVAANEVRRQKLTMAKSEHEANAALTKMENAAHAVNEKEAELAYVKSQIERRQVIAPISGVITERERHEGEWVQAGEPILTIVYMDRVRIVVLLNSDDYSPAQVMGKSVSIIASSPGVSDYKLTGNIEYASEVINAGKQFKVWLDVENKQVDGFWVLRPGLDVDVSFEQDMSVAVPEKAPAVRRKTR